MEVEGCPSLQDLTTGHDIEQPHEETHTKIEPKRQDLEEQQDLHTKNMLRNLEEQERNATNKVLRESLQWEIKVIKQAIKEFLKIEQLYEAHKKQTTLPLVLFKFKHNRNLEELKP